ncbi:MAG: ATP-dependent Clp protease adapter ClpS [Campylobacteraceae bacterium]
MGTKIAVSSETKNRTKEPRNYAVVLLNDDFTSMDFVIEVLMTYFNHDIRSAFDIMLKVHNEGRGVCGIYPFEIAETKISLVHSFARTNNFPLRAILQEE